MMRLIDSFFASRTKQFREVWRRLISNPRTAGLTLVTIIGSVSIFTVWSAFLVPRLAVNLPTTSPISDYLGGIFWALVLTCILFLIPIRSRKVVVALWGVRCLVALGAMLFYEAHYIPHDAIRFFSAANSPSYEWSWFVLGNGSWNMERLVWFQVKTLGVSYHAIKVTFAFMGLLGTYWFYRASSLYLNRDARTFLILLGVIPSVVFWSSAIGKDPVILLALGIYSYGVALWHRRRTWRGWIWSGVGILIASYLRLWMAMIMVGAMLILILLSLRKVAWKVGFILLSVFLFLGLGTRLMQRIGLDTLDSILPKLSEIVQGLSYGGSAQVLDGSFETWLDVITFIPRGAFSALFRPFPWEAHNIFMFAAGVESLILLGFIAITIFRIRINRLRDKFVLWALSYFGAWTLIYSFLSYGNLGAGFRFRLQAMPFLLGLALELGWREEQSVAQGDPSHRESVSGTPNS